MRFLHSGLKRHSLGGIRLSSLNICVCVSQCLHCFCAFPFSIAVFLLFASSYSYFLFCIDLFYCYSLDSCLFTEGEQKCIEKGIGEDLIGLEGRV